MTTGIFAACGEAAVTSTDVEEATTQIEQAATEEIVEKTSTMRDITTMELVQDMGVGINLGNTLEATGSWINGSCVNDYETSWGSPTITQEIIEGYAECGFGVLRIPVAWSNLMDDDYTISEELLERVDEVATWAIDAGMYAIINIHWDGGWFDDFADESKRDEAMIKYTRVWEQISDYFKDYSDYLMFESLNEEGGWDDLWNRYSNEGDKELSYSILNEMNQNFVDIVRASGGNNEERHLLIAGYQTDVTLTCDELFKMPDDPMNRCAVSVHYYTPSTFAILEADASWGKAKTEWGSDSDYEELYKYMDMLKETFIDNGIPVIIGEYGVATSNKTDEMVVLYLSSICEAAYTRGICPVLWDITDVLYIRSTQEFKYPELLSNLMSILELDRG